MIRSDPHSPTRRTAPAVPRRIAASLLAAALLLALPGPSMAGTPDVSVPPAAPVPVRQGPISAAIPAPGVRQAPATSAAIPAPEPQPPASAAAPALLRRVTPSARTLGMDELLALPARQILRSEAQIADDAIAAAVERRSSERTAPAESGFRKRDQDLFSSEHPVEIGEQEMLLRLRLRARARETMSVELRF